VFKNVSITVVGIYRPPSLVTNSQFVKEFFNFMEDILPENKNLMIFGDFNLHVNEDISTTRLFHDSLFSMGLEQHVNFSTHIGGNFLDLVITEVTNGINIQSCEPGPFFFDHCAVKVVTKVEKEIIKLFHTETSKSCQT
jgi:hypothetical protein